jgi:hypothetical protein
MHQLPVWSACVSELRYLQSEPKSRISKTIFSSQVTLCMTSLGRSAVELSPRSLQAAIGSCGSGYTFQITGPLFAATTLSSQLHLLATYPASSLRFIDGMQSIFPLIQILESDIAVHVFRLLLCPALSTYFKVQFHFLLSATVIVRSPNRELLPGETYPFKRTSTRSKGNNLLAWVSVLSSLSVPALWVSQRL